MSFILLKTFSNYIEANIALSMLEREGINCHIEDENIVTIINLASGIRLMVFQSQAERALEILKDAELEYLNNLSCPRCNQAGFDIKYVTAPNETKLNKLPFGRIATAIFNLFNSGSAASPVKHYVCRNCHTEFDEMPPGPV
jgi:hypothetical protein